MLSGAGINPSFTSLRDIAQVEHEWDQGMDTLRGYRDGMNGHDDADDALSASAAAETDDEALMDPPQSFGSDERRMHVRAYNYWAKLLGSRVFPSIEDLDPENLPDFGPNSVLLDFSSGIENPAVQFLGARLAEIPTDPAQPVLALRGRWHRVGGVRGPLCLELPIEGFKRLLQRLQVSNVGSHGLLRIYCSDELFRVYALESQSTSMHSSVLSISG